MNGTTFNVTEPAYGSWEWGFHQAASLIFAAMELYILVCLLRYEFRKSSRQRSSSQANLSHSDSTTIRGRASTAPKTLKAKREIRNVWLSRLTIYSCAAALMLSLCNEIDLFLGTKNQPACMAYGIMLMCSYGSNLVANMLILWLRQDAVQDNRALASLPRRKVRIYFSRFLLGFMLTTFVVIWCLSVIGPYLEPSPQGCIFADKGTISQSTRALSGLIFTVVFSPAFAIMLLYPFLKRMPKDQKKGRCGMSAARRIHLVIRRTLISLFLIIITDVGAIIASFYLENDPLIWVSMVYDLNAFIGVLSVIYAYHDWRKRVRLTCIPRTSGGSLSHSVVSYSSTV